MIPLIYIELLIFHGETTLKLTGIEIQNFRSIGEKPVVLKPLRKCNILIGKNNSGKSNVMRAFHQISSWIQDDSKNRLVVKMVELDRFRRNSQNPIMFKLTFLSELYKTNEKVKVFCPNNEVWFNFTEKLGRERLYIENYSLAYGQDMGRGNEYLNFLNYRPMFDYRSKPQDIEAQLLRLIETNADDITSTFYRFLETPPSLEIIPEFRQIIAGDNYKHNGTNLIKRLYEYQHPSIGQDTDKEKFYTIEQYMRDLLHLPDAKLEVSHDETLIVEDNDLRLPLESYGTGVHQLIILATAIISIENSIVCIEEPEIHLHPTLQREFIQFLVEKTTNQYLISTHSPTLINAHTTMPKDTRDQIQVFHIQLENGATVGGPVSEDTQSLLALNDLGVRASDILQSNCVIWVEGPSDRIYLNKWLEILAPNLIEGLHYSVMFYGGRLLSHLSAERKIINPDEKVPEELIKILKINQNAIVIIDSDRKAKGQRINATKKRVEKDCDDNNNICWITDGREIENYLSPATIVRTLQKDQSLNCTIKLDNPYTKFDDVFTRSTQNAGKKLNYTANKVKFARLFVDRMEESDLLPELRKRLDKVIEKIRLWNV